MARSSRLSLTEKARIPTAIVSIVSAEEEQATQAAVEINGIHTATQIATLVTNRIHTVGAPAAMDCTDVLEHQKQAVEAKKTLAVQTTPMQPEVETEQHDNQMYKMPMELRDDYHVNLEKGHLGGRGG
ncbi:hypothetical protein ACH5RR_015564 [Cinchona calisaya]|uniref:Late embryogenesis abundant protein n=1 Tax=Cinchona calisaya TaxID=153742 RepID=A0ABD2ZWM6_9GENT